MSDETYVTIKGRLTADPELRYGTSGSAVSNFTVATRSRRFDKTTNDWKDQPTKFWRCAAWDQGKLVRAQNIANLLKKSDNVIVYGELTTREYQKDGQTHKADEIRIESIGKDLTFHGQAYAANETQSAAADQGWGGQQAGGWDDPPAATDQGGWGNGSSATY
ncbi:single-stranded DNA-binding protein [Pseudarthrobacter sp. LT1]|uniref:single-stranded DNA-binding protein n=1 Tax=Pseudarthrobacter sp. LT1 TaxID=3111450 RepID=UPI002D76D1AF|nr:single-stranded DNA-binding protein [Pseudarthrobacter sp. LT1]WRT14687.1 single-stranded DNA-binding protein [Pseudarthrobacter sp. LT1]